MIYYTYIRIFAYVYIYRVCAFNFFSCKLPVAFLLAFVLFVSFKNQFN